MRIFFDNNLPPALARAVRELCVIDTNIDLVEHIRDRLDRRNHGIDDLTWISALSSSNESWIVFTQDGLSKNDAEKEAVTQSGLRFYYLNKSWARLKYWDKSIRLISWLPRVIDHAANNSSGVFTIPCRMGTSGKIKRHKGVKKR